MRVGKTENEGKWTNSDIGSFLSESANSRVKNNSGLEKENHPKFKNNTESNSKGRFDDRFIKFRDLMKDKIDINELMELTIQKNPDLNQLNRIRARSSLLETFREVYMPPDDLERTIQKTREAYDQLFFNILPTIYKVKYLGRQKEEERMMGIEQKQESTEWNFKLKSLKQLYFTSVVNFEGRTNVILEQIFEIVNTNFYSIISLLDQYKDLTTNTRILSFAKNYLGGFNKGYFDSLALYVIEEKLPSFLNFFFLKLIPATIPFFNLNWSSWFQTMRSSCESFPDAHIFLNTLRQAFSVPEIRIYSIKLFESIGKFVLTMKVDQTSSSSKQKERVRLQSCLSPKIVIPSEIMGELLEALNPKEMGNCIIENPHLTKIFEMIITKSRKYIEQSGLDSNNLYLITFFIQLYCILIPNTLGVTRTIVGEYELNYQYMFMTTHMLESPFEVCYLESNPQTIGFHALVLDFLNCAFPSLIFSMMQRESTDFIDKVLLTYGSHLSSISDESIFEKNEQPVISAFADRIMVVPVEEFEFFIRTLLNLKEFSPIAMQYYPTTFTLLEVSIEELKEIKPSFDKKMNAFLQENLNPNGNILIYVSTNITSLYNENTLSEVPSDFLKFIEIRSEFLEKYMTTLEKVMYIIVQSSVERNYPELDLRRNEPLLLNQHREVSQFLIDSVKLDTETKEILEMIVDNCSLYMLWGLLQTEEFEVKFANEIDLFSHNTSILKAKIDIVLKLKKISNLLSKDLEYIESLKEIHSHSLNFAENFYLRNFYLTGSKDTKEYK